MYKWFLFLFFTNTVLTAQDNIQKDLFVLCSDSLNGRFSGSLGDKLTQHYIFKRMKDAGYKVNKQKVEFSYNGAKIKTYNLIWTKKGKSKEEIIIGAHYDHLGTSGEKSYEIFDKKNVHFGADDNASGVSVLMALADTLNHISPAKTITFVAFGGHELGLNGSKTFASTLKKSRKIQLMINLDMIGRLNDDYKKLIVNTVEKKYVESEVFKRNDQFDFRIESNQLWHLDHTVFNKIGIPTLSLTTGNHKDYHKSTDTPEKVNIKGLNLIKNFIIGFLDLEF